MDDTNEVDVLRARVQDLEGQLAATGTGATSPAPPHRSAWWAVSSAILLVLACLLSPVAVTSVWARTQVTNTNAYVDTVAPIADDPAVQAAIANQVTTIVLDKIDVSKITTEALTSLSQINNLPPRVAASLPALAAPISNGIEGFTKDQVNKAVRTPQFATVWAQVNRIAHQQVLRLLQGKQGGALSAQGNSITLNLGPIVAQVKSRMVSRGFALAQKIPAVNRSFTVVQSNQVSKVQSAYRLLNSLGTWLPFVCLALFGGGIALARNRWRAVVRGALGLTAAMVVLGAGLTILRTTYVQSTPAGILTPEAAGNVFDILVRFLRTSLRSLAVLGLVVALAAHLSGSSPSAARTRAAFERLVSRVRGEGSGPVASWVGAHRRTLRGVIVTAGGLTLVFWSSPTGWVVLWVAVVTALLVAALELVAGRPRPAVATGATAAAQPEPAPLPAQREPSDAADAAPSHTPSAP